MARENAFRLASIAFAASLCIQVAGCSIIGLTAGAIIDASAPDEKRINPWEIGSAKPGSYATISLKDGRSVFGRYQDFAPLSEDDYGKSYDLLRDQEQDWMALPRLGETVDIYYRGTDSRRSAFFGFDYRYRSVVGASANELSYNFQFLVLDGISASSNRYIFLCDVDTLVNGDKTVLAGNDLRLLSSEGMLPLRSTVALETTNGIESIPFGSIDKALVPNKRHAKWVGLGLGFIVDVAIAIAVASTDWHLIDLGNSGSF
jgi:hypothetical protein